MALPSVLVSLSPRVSIEPAELDVEEDDSRTFFTTLFLMGKMACSSSNIVVDTPKFLASREWGDEDSRLPPHQQHSFSAGLKSVKRRVDA